jgi:hypothetical protein
VTFIAFCECCGQIQERPPEQVSGASVACLRCGTPLTAGGRPRPAPHTEPPPAAAETVPFVDSLSTVVETSAPPVPAPRSLKWQAPKRVRPATDEDDESDGGPFRLSVVGVAALFLTVAALFAASIGPATAMVRPLAAAGFLAGLVATRSAYWHGRHLVISGGVSGLAAAVLMASFVVPGLLGPRFRASVGPPPPAPLLQVIPHPQFASDPNVRRAEWVDASKAGLREGGVRVEVVQAWIGTRQEGAGGRADVAAGSRLLFVRLRLHRFAPGAEIAKGKSGSPAWKDDAGISLTDATGHLVARQPGSVGDGVSAGTDAPPGSVPDAFETTLVFAAPSGNPEYLRLQLPGSAWGGTVPARFQIPASMIGRSSPRP